MSQITIFLLYLLAAVAFAMNRLPRHASRSGLLLALALGAGLAGLLVHAQTFSILLHGTGSLHLSITGAISLIALLLALIGLLGALDPSLRGMASGLLILAAVASVPLGTQAESLSGPAITWQLQAHILLSMLAYGLLTAGAIVAIYALILDRRLRAGKVASGNPLFAPLETTERLLFGVTAAGFGGLLLSVVSGFAFVEDLFAQHLAHKTILSLIALMLFGTLLGGRRYAGWRGQRAVYLYLWGFVILCLAYFGSRYILEELLGRSWG